MKYCLGFIGFWLMLFGFAIESSDTDLWDIDLLDTDLDLLETATPSKIFICLLQDAFKASWRHVLKMSARHSLKTSWRRLQRNNFLSSKMYFKTSTRGFVRCLQKTIKSSWEQKILCLEDIFKTFWRPINVCREISQNF